MSLSKSAFKALEGKQSIQEDVRAIVDKHDRKLKAAEEIAEEVGSFRRYAEAWIQSATGDEDTIAKRRKVVNNVCNDISRISRDLTGYTIQCGSRKDHIYEARVPNPRPTSSTITTPPSPVPPPSKAAPVLNEEELRYLARHRPVSVMSALLDELDSDRFMEVLKAAKELKETLEGNNT